MWSWIIGPIAGPILGAALLASLAALGVTWTVQRWEISRLTDELAVKKDEIENSKTGWVRRFDQCETNYATVALALKRQGDDIRNLAKATEDGNKLLADRLESAEKQVTSVRTNTNKLLAAAPTAPIGTLAACQAGAKILKSPATVGVP